MSKKLVHYLVSVNLAKGIGVFKWRTTNSTHWAQANVSLSSILMSRIETRYEWDRLPLNVPYKKHEFISACNSPEYADSPFRLVLFKKGKQTDVKFDSYYLECVDEWGKAIEDEALGEVIGYESGWRKARNFIRYEVRKIQKLVKDMEETTVRVEPMLKRIKV